MGVDMPFTAMVMLRVLDVFKGWYSGTGRESPEVDVVIRPLDSKGNK